MTDNATATATAAAPAPAPSTLAGAAALATQAVAPAADAVKAPELATANGGADPWYHTLPADLHPFIANKGWSDPAAAVKSYVELEKTFGADKAGRTVVLPKDDAKPEERAEFMAKVGLAAPAKPEDYQIKIDGLSPDLVNDAKTWMHKAQVAPTQAQALVEAYAQHEMAAIKAWETKSKAEVDALAIEWGPNYNANVELGRRAVRAVGLDDAALNSIERAVGTANMLKMFTKFGENLSEAQSPPAGGAGDNQFRSTPVQAKQKIDSLRGDPSFMSRYLSPNEDVRMKAVTEMENLMKTAFPG